MTRQHFAAVAKDFRTFLAEWYPYAPEPVDISLGTDLEEMFAMGKTEGRIIGAQKLAEMLADTFETFNPQFDRDRFLKACKPKGARA